MPKKNSPRRVLDELPLTRHAAANGRSLSDSGLGRPRGGTMSELHWTVQAIPIVIIGGVVLTWLLGRHKEKKSSEHIFKID